MMGGDVGQPVQQSIGRKKYMRLSNQKRYITGCQVGTGLSSNEERGRRSTRAIITRSVRKRMGVVKAKKLSNQSRK